MKLKPLILCLLTAAAAHGATLQVTSTGDSGTGSLRTQVAAAASGDTVSITATGTIALTTGEIAITNKNLSIVGPGADKLTITTGATTRALRVVTAECKISGMTFSNCNSLSGDLASGGAIAVDNFTVNGTNYGTSYTTTINDCTFTANQSGWGGAVDIFQGGLQMNRCTFSSNTCTGLSDAGLLGGGGAVSLGPTLPSAIVNCTFSGNSQNGTTNGQPGGGAIYNYGVDATDPKVVTIEHCTFFANLDAAAAAGAIKGNYNASYKTRADLKNCLLVNNQAPTAVLRNFSGNTNGILSTVYSSLGGNVTDESATSGLFMSPSTDKFGNTAAASSLSTTLALNGGTTKTQAILRGSVAQHSGASSTIATDQRGAPRHATADAGAFELIEPELRVTIATTPLTRDTTFDFGPTRFDQPAMRTITVANTQTSTFVSGPLILGNMQASSGYSISGFPTTTIGNGQSATFDVTLSADPGIRPGSLTFTANDTYDPAIADASSGLPNRYLFNFSGLVTDTVSHWKQQYFGTNAATTVASDESNPANDGIPNLLKYALNLDPMVFYPPNAGITSGLDPDGHLQMTVTKNPAAADVQLAIEAASDYANPTNWSTGDIVIDQDTESILQGHDTHSPFVAKSRFLRLKVLSPGSTQ
jgi:hypothetical protein